MPLAMKFVSSEKIHVQSLSEKYPEVTPTHRLQGNKSWGGGGTLKLNNIAKT